MITIGKRIWDSFTIALVVTCHAALAFAANAAGSPSLTPVKLTCQGLANPQGLDAATPGLSWISISADPTGRGQIQTAYQILVADSRSHPRQEGSEGSTRRGQLLKLEIVSNTTKTQAHE